MTNDRILHRQPIHQISSYHLTYKHTLPQMNIDIYRSELTNQDRHNKGMLSLNVQGGHHVAVISMKHACDGESALTMLSNSRPQHCFTHQLL